MNRFFYFQPRNFRHETITPDGSGPITQGDRAKSPVLRCGIGIATGIGLAVGIPAVVGAASVGLGAYSLANKPKTSSGTASATPTAAQIAQQNNQVLQQQSQQIAQLTTAISNDQSAINSLSAAQPSKTLEYVGVGLGAAGLLAAILLHRKK